MSNVIIVIVLLIIAGLGIKETAKHFKGEGACCGGASSKPQKKKLKNKIIVTYDFRVEGMHCQNCANAVTRAVNEINGASAKVSLKRKRVKVFCDREIDTRIIMDSIEKRGYEVYPIN